jgi:phage terminase large subunit-like protein
MPQAFSPVDRFTTEEASDFAKLYQPEAKRLFLQAFFRRDFLSFVYLLGYRDIGEFHKKEIESLGKCRFLESQPVRRLWLWSRGFFKTSLITEAHSTWLIVNNPNIRLLLVSWTLDVAKKPLAAIRNHFITNSDFRYFFKEFCPVPNSEGKIEFGTTENFTVPNRTKGYKEPTLMCAGVGTNITGLHFDWMKIDDLVTKDSVTNDVQVQASKDYYSLLRPIFDNPTFPREDIIGTIYHFNDLHSAILKNPDFEKSIVPIESEGVYNFPERIDHDAFLKLCADPNMNPYDIQSQYYLNPIDPSQRKFKDEWIKYYDETPNGLSEYLLCDPASSKKKTSDFTVIERWGVDSNENFYLLDGIRDRLGSNERVDLYVGMAKQAKRLKGARYEVIGGRHGDLENIHEKFIEAHLGITPLETKATTASKVDRIEQRLVGRFNAGIIYLPRTMKKVSKHDGKTYDFVQEYLLEYRQFPFSEHDDILDCHSQLHDGEYIVLGAKKLKPTTSEDDEFEWWRKKAMEFHNPHRKKFVFGSKLRGTRIPFTESFR